MICGARTMNNAPTSPSTNALYFPAVHTDCSARSGFFAPSAWPTIVAAALPSPHAGIIAKITRRMPIVYPARASLPKVEMTRTSPM